MANKNAKNKTNNNKKNNTNKKVNNNQKNVTKKVTSKEDVKKENVKVEQIAKEVKVLLVVACIVTSTKKESKVDIELPVAVEGVAGTKTISYTEYEELMNSNKPFLMVIIQDGCGYCEMYEPVVEEVANELGIPVNYLNLTNLSSEESNKLSKSNSYLKKNQWGTPTTLFMVGDKVIDSIGQYVDKDTFVSFVKENIKVDVNE